MTLREIMEAEERTGPSIKRGKSKQDYETPPEFMRAIHNHFGVPTWDLAATKENKKAENYITEEADSLTFNWHRLGGPLYLNPPFDNIRPWAEKCFAESVGGAKILFLVPASTGSTWFADFVYHKAIVHFLSGRNYRIKFVGADDPYPKDLMLVEYDETKFPGFQLWPWRSYV